MMQNPPAFNPAKYNPYIFKWKQYLNINRTFKSFLLKVEQRSYILIYYILMFATKSYIFSHYSSNTQRTLHVCCYLGFHAIAIIGQLSSTPFTSIVEFSCLMMCVTSILSCPTLQGIEHSSCKWRHFTTIIHPSFLENAIRN